MATLLRYTHPSILMFRQALFALQITAAVYRQNLLSGFWLRDVVKISVGLDEMKTSGLWMPSSHSSRNKTTLSRPTRIASSHDPPSLVICRHCI